MLMPVLMLVVDVAFAARDEAKVISVVAELDSVLSAARDAERTTWVERLLVQLAFATREAESAAAPPAGWL